MPPVVADGSSRDANLVAADVCDAPAAPPRHGALHDFGARCSRLRVAEAVSYVVRIWCKCVPTRLSAPRAELEGPAKDVRAAESVPEREVLLNVPTGMDGKAAAHHHGSYVGNKVVTAKYNLLTFLPRFMFEMFSRVAYMCAPLRCATLLCCFCHLGLSHHAYRACCSYFLVQMALTWWPAVSPFDPWGSTIALAFVLAVSAVKALWEDAKRHRDDWAINKRLTRVMCGDGAFRQVPWRSVRVGDVVLVRRCRPPKARLLPVYLAPPVHGPRCPAHPAPGTGCRRGGAAC